MNNNGPLAPMDNDPFTHSLDFFSDKPAIKITFMDSYILISTVRFDGKKQYAFDIYEVKFESDYQARKIQGFLMSYGKLLYKTYSNGNT